MTNGYDLDSNESVVLKNTRVKTGGVFATYTDELVLTNLNIIYINKNFLGKVKSVNKYSVKQIKVYNDKAQALLGTDDRGYPQLEVYLKSGQVAFGFETKTEIKKWVNSINELVTGDPGPYPTSDNIAFAGAAIVADTLKGTIDAFQQAFGKKQEKVTANCNSCNAPLIGFKGQTVTCKYCGSKQVL